MRLLLAMVAALPACATIGTPNRFQVPIDSTPSDAVVLCDGAEVGRTPCVVVLPRGEKPLLTLRKDGFHDQPVQVENVFPPLPFLVIDIIIFPFIIVDMASGAKWQVDTAPLSVQLMPATAQRPPIWRRSDYDVDAARETSRPR